jgi:hypothetical protein
MASFKKTNVKIYTKTGPNITPDTIYWKKLGVCKFLNCDLIHLESSWYSYFRVLIVLPLKVNRIYLCVSFPRGLIYAEWWRLIRRLRYMQLFRFCHFYAVVLLQTFGFSGSRFLITRKRQEFVIGYVMLKRARMECSGDCLFADVDRACWQLASSTLWDKFSMPTYAEILN